ncbi:MAG: hypothetical protein KDD39_05035 [Bdellovibrionales bacterium]|nr:hypothetical protein [Bdellovibrionales bacterium]
MRYQCCRLLLLFLIAAPGAHGGLKRRGFEPRYVDWYRSACPSNVEAWRHVRFSLAKDLSNPKNRKIPFDSSKEKGAFLAYAWLDKCLTEPDVLDVLEKNPQVAACIRPTEQYLHWFRTLYKKHRGNRGLAALGFAVEDSLYNKEAAARTPIPAELRDQRFLEALGRLDTVPEAFNWLRAVNKNREFRNLTPWEFLFFESSIPTEDVSHSRARLLVSIPESNEGPSRYFLFALPNEKGRASDEASSISLHKDGAFFFQYWRRKRQRRFSLQRYRTLKSGRCVECHKSGGPLTLRPTEPSDAYKKIYAAWGKPHESLALKEKLNKEILSVGLVYSKFDITPREGAGLGDGSGARLDDEFFEICARPVIEKLLRRSPSALRAYNFDASYRRLAAATNCTSCHDGKTRSLLSPPFDRALHFFVSGGNMPPSSDLSAVEKVALSACLEDEYWGYFNAKKEYVPGSLFRHLMSVSCVTEESP